MYDVLIIGAGPAGASAALFAAKAGKKTLLIDNDKSMTKMAWIENHYGVMEITGPDLVQLGKDQAKKFGAELYEEKVVKLEASADGVTVTSESGSHKAKHVIIATGTSVEIAGQSGLATIPGTEPHIKTIVQTDAAGKTALPGVWAAGTCAGVSVHTIITAGDGAKVAVNVISELNGQRYADHDVLKK